MKRIIGNEKIKKSHGYGPLKSHHFCFYALMTYRAREKKENGETFIDWIDCPFSYNDMLFIFRFFGIQNDSIHAAINHYIICELLEKKNYFYFMTHVGIDWYNSMCLSA